ncbi:MAG: hypothetical protein NVSMB21_18030 [Vulcanimicrobiaceae bacterium]
MKIATSSTSFARAIAAERLSQLEWLDICANELEVDAVVFDAAQFPRLDDEYLAQLKKLAVDLGLSVAALSADAIFAVEGDRWLAVADRLGAPLVLGRAPQAAADPGAWGAFADLVKERARAAKRANVTLALSNATGTLCASSEDLRRLAKDVDSAWLRFAPDPLAFGAGAGADAGATSKSVLVRATIGDLATFARDDDRSANDLLRALARFRGCVLLDSRADADADVARGSYHLALQRFAAARARALALAQTA